MNYTFADEFVLLIPGYSEATPKLVEQALEMPTDFWTEVDELGQTWGITFGTHRDDDNIGKSNWDAMLEMLTEKFGPSDETNWDVMHSSHWAVGWADQIILPVVKVVGMDDQGDAIYEVTPQFEWALEVKGWLENYPLLDDSDYSEREYNDVLEMIGWHLPTSEFSLNDKWYEVSDNLPADIKEQLSQHLEICHSDDVYGSIIEEALIEMGHAHEMKEEAV